MAETRNKRIQASLEAEARRNAQLYWVRKQAERDEKTTNPKEPNHDRS